MSYVNGTGDDRVNDAIRVPDKITCDDGRELCLQSWMPVVEMDSIVGVTLTAIIKMPDGD